MTYNTEAMREAIVQKLRLNYGCTEKQANEAEMMKACALVLRDIMAERGVRTKAQVIRDEKRKVHYMSLEFLMGRSLVKNAFNLGLLGPMREALEQLGFSADEVFEAEPDAALGNGGLGRLAACYLDSMTTLEIPATGYSICYDLGIFRQKIVDGQQLELRTTGRTTAATRGCCKSRRRRRRSTSAASSAPGGTTATSWSSTRTIPVCWPCRAT